ncbi:MAG: hypothetical protein H6672_15970 [Anaerolineaceae bacterium]|nr:hypothetical protein [Anaerolineaceae bacterium]
MRRRSILSIVPKVALLILLLTLSFAGTQAQDSPADCPLGHGYWGSHADWPVTELTLGSQTYNQAELLVLLNTSSGGDASLILAHQLIAAKVNVANGADGTVIAGVMTEADNLLSTYADKLPYAVDPASPEGQTLVNLANVLDSFNNGLLSAGCMTPTPPPAEATPEVTLEVTVVPGEDSGAIIIIIEGPVQAININIITIYNINIQLDPDDPILTVIQIGDVIRVSGQVVQSGTTIVIVAINIIFINVDVVIFEGDIWRDDGNCGNPPPPWAPANGWHRRCDNNSGNGSSRKS